MRAAAVLILVILLAGCAAPAPGSSPTPEGPSSELRVGNALLHAGGARGGLALVHLAEGESAQVTFPADVLVLTEGKLRPGGEPVSIARGEVVQFLAPMSGDAVNVTVAADGDSREVALPLDDGDAFASGARAVQLLKVQRDQFAHRTPGHENYTKAVDYFGAFFADLGYDVENFRTPLPDALPVPAPLPASPQSLVSVLGYKRGTDMPERYVVFGGHFDVVEGTTHGAFDNTGGTMAVLALAEAYAKFDTSRTFIFAAWGGEEDGILGSQAWLTAHPEIAPNIDLYVNYDVTGLAWPAPFVDPAPVVAATGPDGPIADALAAEHRVVISDWMKLDAPFVYETVAAGQATGAGVNAQSDHTPFMSRGIPVLFQFTQRVSEVRAIIHSEADTVENMTGYALLGPEGIGQELNATQVREGEAALARSFETQMMAGFYLATLLDAGVISPPRPASFPALENVRS